MTLGQLIRYAANTRKMEILVYLLLVADGKAIKQLTKGCPKRLASLLFNPCPVDRGSLHRGSKSQLVQFTLQEGFSHST